MIAITIARMIKHFSVHGRYSNIYFYNIYDEGVWCFSVRPNPVGFYYIAIMQIFPLDVSGFGDANIKHVIIGYNFHGTKISSEIDGFFILYSNLIWDFYFIFFR